MKATPPPPPTRSRTPEGLRVLRFPCMGTECVVQFTASSEEQATCFELEALQWLWTFEQRYSRYKPDSLVSRINAAAGGGWVACDPELEQMLHLCGMVHQMSGGLIDATALPLLQLWDYKTTHERLPSDAEISRAMALVGWNKVQIRPGALRLPFAGMGLDLGGFGKEWAVDMVWRLAVEHGLGCALVDIGHDIRAHGLPPGRSSWSVGIEDPDCPGRALSRIALEAGMAVASSGDYIRHFSHGGVRYGHIVDPRSGRPVSNGCLQVTVVAPSCLRAGILSTAAFVAGTARGLTLIEQMPGAEGLLLGRRDRGQTRGFWRLHHDGVPGHTPSP